MALSVLQTCIWLVNNIFKVTIATAAEAISRFAALDTSLFALKEYAFY